MDNEVNALPDGIAQDLFNAQLPIAPSEMFVSYVTDLDPGEPLSDGQRFSAADTAEILKAVELLWRRGFDQRRGSL